MNPHPKFVLQKLKIEKEMIKVKFIKKTVCRSKHQQTTFSLEKIGIEYTKLHIIVYELLVVVQIYTH